MKELDHLGERLLELRKEKKLSQEEVADKLNVTRQTISKWETDQSTPDFDKIVPLCELYGITPNELFIELKEKEPSKKVKPIFDFEEEMKKSNKKAKGIAISILLYFISIVWIMIAIPVLNMNPIVASALFLLICGLATGIIVYVCIRYKKIKNDEEETETEKLINQISNVVAIIVLIFYLVISFKTMAWNLTWIIWVIYGLFEEILKLIFMLRGTKDEK